MNVHELQLVYDSFNLIDVDKGPTAQHEPREWERMFLTFENYVMPHDRWPDHAQGPGCLFNDVNGKYWRHTLET